MLGSHLCLSHMPCRPSSADAVLEVPWRINLRWTWDGKLENSTSATSRAWKRLGRAWYYTELYTYTWVVHTEDRWTVRYDWVESVIKINIVAKSVFPVFVQCSQCVVLVVACKDLLLLIASILWLTLLLLCVCLLPLCTGPCLCPFVLP